MEGDCVGGRRLVAQGSPEKQKLFGAFWVFLLLLLSLLYLFLFANPMPISYLLTQQLSK